MRFLVFSLSYFGLRLSGEEGLKGAVFYDGRTADYGVNGLSETVCRSFLLMGICLPASKTGRRGRRGFGLWVAVRTTEEARGKVQDEDEWMDGRLGHH